MSYTHPPRSLGAVVAHLIVGIVSIVFHGIASLLKSFTRLGRKS